MNGPDSEPTRPGPSPASTTSLRKKLAASRLDGKTNRPSWLDGTSIDRNGKAGWGSMTDINLLLSKEAKSTRGCTACVISPAYVPAARESQSRGDEVVFL